MVAIEDLTLNTHPWANMPENMHGTHKRYTVIWVSMLGTDMEKIIERYTNRTLEECFAFVRKTVSSHEWNKITHSIEIQEH